MKIEIWSDVMCPFCYIGKRNFETALAQFADQKQVEVIWKSFQLDASIPETANETQEDYLVKRKGMSQTQVRAMLENVTNSAKQVGLDYRLDHAQMVNSYKAHQLIQFAKTKDLGDAAEERLFRAFFTEGKSIADLDTLTQLGKEIGLDTQELQTAFTDPKYTKRVQDDIEEAMELGVSGVPFFVMNRKYAVSGAQPPQVFLETLQKAFAEWSAKNPASPFEVSQGPSCSNDGVCD